MKLSAKLAKTKYDHNKDSETHLLVELEAPKVKWEKERAPICVVPVLDVSGSMAGPKLEYVQKACRKFVDHLSCGDFLGIVAFDSHIQEVVPIVEINQYQKDQLKKKISELYVSGCTNTSGGLSTAFKWIEEMKLPENVVLRVVLFTDGHANVGVTGRENLLEFVKKQRGKATLSVFGFGTDCDQELLADMATKGEGNYAYIDSPDTALTAFARELGGLMSTYSQDITIKVSPSNNNRIVEILNDEDVEDDNGNAVIKIRDILGEEKKWIVAKVNLEHVEKAFPRKVKVFNIEVSYKDMDGKVQSLKQVPIKITFCKPGEEPKEEDGEVVRQRDRLLAARAQDQAEAFARAGNYQQAGYTITNCINSIQDGTVKGVLENISSYYCTPTSYSLNTGLTNTVKRSLKSKRSLELSGVSATLCVDAGNVNTSAMNDMINKFTNEDDVSDNVKIDDNNFSIGSFGVNSSQTLTATKSKSNKDW